MARLHPAWPIAARTAGQCPDWGLRGGLSIYLYLYLYTEVLLLIQLCAYVLYNRFFALILSFLQSNHTYLIPSDF